MKQIADPRACCCAALLCMAGATCVFAGEKQAAAPSRLGPVDVSAGWAHVSRQGDGALVSAGGGVKVAWEGARLTADRAVIWAFPPKEPVSGLAKELEEARRRKDPDAFAELSGKLDVTVYAEGGVRVEWGGGDVLTCDSFLYDFEAMRGVMRNARADLPSAFGKTHVPPGSRLMARAEEIRVALRPEGGGKVVLKDASITDCEYIEPHYEFAATEITLEIGEGKDPSVWATLWNITPRAFGIPLFWLPAMVWDADWRPMIRIKPGHSASMGWFVKAGIGMEIKVPKPGKPESLRRAATLWALADWLELRGPAAGLEGRWNWPGDSPGRGDALLYYVRDRGDDREAARLLGWYPPQREDRWRAYLYHRESVPSVGARAEIEINSASDAYFLREFFEPEVRTSKPPESYLQVTEAWENHSAALVYKPRLNEFLTEAEELPRFRYGAVSQPLPLGLGVIDAGLMADHVRLRPDDRDPSMRSERLWRFDGWAEWALPIRILEVQIEPFMQARYSAFSRRAAGEGSMDRAALEGGVRTSVQAWRDYDLDWSELGIRGLRHVVALHADYLDRFAVTTPPAELVQIDSLERLDLVRRFDFRLVNRLSTWPGGSGSTRDLLFVELEASLYADPERDNAGNRWGPAILDLRVSPTPWASLVAFAKYDLDAGAFVRWDAGLSVEPVRGLKLYVATHNVSETVHSTIARVAARLDERWAVEFEEMYDFERGQQVSAALRVRRTLHRWILEVGLHADRTRDDLGVSVAFMPLLTAPPEWW